MENSSTTQQTQQMWHVSSAKSCGQSSVFNCKDLYLSIIKPFCSSGNWNKTHTFQTNIVLPAFILCNIRFQERYCYASKCVEESTITTLKTNTVTPAASYKHQGYVKLAQHFTFGTVPLGMTHIESTLGALLAGASSAGTLLSPTLTPLHYSLLFFSWILLSQLMFLEVKARDSNSRFFPGNGSKDHPGQ